MMRCADHHRTVISPLQLSRSKEAVGQRTFLDVLNAEQTLLSAQAGVVTDRRTISVAEYSVMSAIGRLSIQELEGRGQRY